MESLIPEISHLLNNTLSLDQTVVSAAADKLDLLSGHPLFPFSLLATTRGGGFQSLKFAAAIYLKNFVRCHEVEIRANPLQHIEFRNQLVQTLFQVDRSVLKVLVEAAMSANIYNLLTISLTMADDGYLNYYPIRASAAGAITELITNQYFPPNWLPLLQVLVNILHVVDENESSLFFNLLSTVIEDGMEKVAAHIPLLVPSIADVILRNIPSNSETWPQVLEHGFTALAHVVQVWENSLPDDVQIPENGDRSGWSSITKLVSSLLQGALLRSSIKKMPSSCIRDASALLGFVVRFITEMYEVTSLKIPELLAVWSNMIADWDSWEEMEDYVIFNSIHEVVNLHKKCELQSLFNRRVPLASPFPGSKPSIFEGICCFVNGAITAYPSAVWLIMHTCITECSYLLL